MKARVQAAFEKALPQIKIHKRAPIDVAVELSQQDHLSPRETQQLLDLLDTARALEIQREMKSNDKT
jgi:hypothetical protein